MIMVILLSLYLAIPPALQLLPPSDRVNDSATIHRRDRLDPLPRWKDTGSLYTAAVARMRFGVYPHDHVEFAFDEQGQLQTTATMTGRSRPHINSESPPAPPLYPTASPGDSVRLLAWQIAKHNPSVRVQKALVWGRSIDSTGKPRWYLMRLSRFFEGNRTSASPKIWRLPYENPFFKKDSSAALPRPQPLAEFDHPPSNREVEAFLDTWRDIEGGFLVFDPKTRVDPDGYRFTDGDVRERTWQAAIGEAATRFLPNGK